MGTTPRAVALALGLAAAAQALGPTTTLAADDEEGPASTAAAPTADPGIAPGQRVPDFTLPDVAGGTFRLADHRGGPVVLVFFRGTW